VDGLVPVRGERIVAEIPLLFEQDDGDFDRAFGGLRPDVKFGSSCAGP
jgi:hypothetical protein